MQAANDLGDRQRAVGVRQPVKIDAEHRGVQAAQELLHVQILVVEHHGCQVDYPDAVAGLVQLHRHGGEPEGVHLEDGRGRHQVAYRAVEH